MSAREIAGRLSADERQAWREAGTLVVGFKSEADFLKAIENGLAAKFHKVTAPQFDRQGVQWWLAEPTAFGLEVRRVLESE